MAFAGFLPNMAAQNPVAVNDEAIIRPLQKAGEDVMFNHATPFADALPEGIPIAQGHATPANTTIIIQIYNNEYETDNYYYNIFALGASQPGNRLRTNKEMGVTNSYR
ncbi:MAG: hypothetical protein LBT78_03235 [Tannerella sp.]|nr:hypothetical protein [Tannerella sp.]